MKQIIKITDVESGKELEMVSDQKCLCTNTCGFNCFYLTPEGCRCRPNYPCLQKKIMFIEKKQDNESK